MTGTIRPDRTAAERRGLRLRWRPLSGDLIDRRGAALVPPILLAVGLSIAAVAGLAYIAGFRAVYTSLTRIQWPWLCAVPAALAMSAIGYYFAYRSIYAAEGGYALSRRQLTAVVAVGFGGLFSTGGIRPDGLVLQAGGASRREAMVRVTTLGGVEQGLLALYGCAASIACLCLGRAGVPVDVTLPWGVIPVPAFAAALPPHLMPGCRCATCKKPPLMLTRAPRSGTTGPEAASTGTPHMSSPRLSRAPLGNPHRPAGPPGRLRPRRLAARPLLSAITSAQR